MTNPTSRLVLLAISVTVFLWASAFVGIRMAGAHFDQARSRWGGCWRVWPR